MRLILLDYYTTCALHVLRVAAGKLGWTVDVFTPASKSLCSFSKFIHKTYKSPLVTERNTYYREFRKLVIKNKYDAFLSFDDDVTSILMENEHDLKRFFQLSRMFPPTKSLLIADSKNKAIEFAKRLEIPTPDFFIPEHELELDEIHKQIKYPVVLKGEKGAASWNVRYANNLSELRLFYKELVKKEKPYHGKPSIQEYIEGEGHLLHVLCYKGEILRVCDHKKVIEYPPNGGITAVAETCYDPSVLSYISKICRDLKWTGLSKFDFIKDKNDGKYKFLEFDPRVSHSIIVPQAAGTEMIESFFRVVQGEHIEPDLSFKTGIQYRILFPTEFQYLARTPRHISDFIKNFFNKDTFHDVDFKDLLPTLIMMGASFMGIIYELIFKKGQHHLVSSQAIKSES